MNSDTWSSFHQSVYVTVQSVEGEFPVRYHAQLLSGAVGCCRVLADIASQLSEVLWLKNSKRKLQICDGKYKHSHTIPHLEKLLF